MIILFLVFMASAFFFFTITSLLGVRRDRRTYRRAYAAAYKDAMNEKTTFTRDFDEGFMTEAGIDPRSLNTR